MSTLADIMGLKDNEAYDFDNRIIRIEAKIQDYTSVIAGFTAKTYENSAKSLSSLGFERGAVTGHEAYNALKNLRLKNNSLDDAFWRDYHATVLFTIDGIVSANKNDVEQSLGRNLDFAQRNFDKVREAIIGQLAGEYVVKIPHMSKQEIINYILDK